MIKEKWQLQQEEEKIREKWGLKDFLAIAIILGGFVYFLYTIQPDYKKEYKEHKASWAWTQKEMKSHVALKPTVELIPGSELFRKYVTFVIRNKKETDTVPVSILRGLSGQRGMYSPLLDPHTVYICDDCGLDPVVLEGVIVHEMVHYIQWSTEGRCFDDPYSPCMDFREMQGYAIQEKYIKEVLGDE
ncbi:hypothetical protein LCGC14_1529230 [marine sediment metagenome]|uniref:Uncharacterized protein n=1 Tax=marine sediment metagenome TaxID=412755 RepID=A0A0F9IW94_9ZZZZ